MNDKLKVIGSYILGLCIFVGLIFVGVMFVKGSVWLGARAYPWLVLIATLAFWVTVLIFLPLAIFRRTRVFAGMSTYFASYAFGLTLWVWAILLSYSLWGIAGIVVGLFLGGIGVVPIAMLASLFNGLWSTLAQLVLLTGITLGSRFLGLYIAMKAADATNSVEKPPELDQV
jgi:hypothetical protein